MTTPVDLTSPPHTPAPPKGVASKKDTPKKAAPKKAAPKKAAAKKTIAKKATAKKTVAAERTIKATTFPSPKKETKAEITKPTPEPSRKSARIAARRMAWSIRMIRSLEESCSGGKKAVPFPPPDRRIEVIYAF